MLQDISGSANKELSDHINSFLNREERYIQSITTKTKELLTLYNSLEDAQDTLESIKKKGLEGLAEQKKKV